MKHVINNPSGGGKKSSGSMGYSKPKRTTKMASTKGYKSKAKVGGRAKGGMRY